MKTLIPAYKDKPVSFVSINTRNPIGQAQSEIKRFKMDYPHHFAKGTNINRDFKVKVLPRLIIVNKAGIVQTDVVYMDEDALREAIDKLLAELATSTASTPNTESAEDETPSKN